PRGDGPRLKAWSDAGVALLSGLTPPQGFGALVTDVIEFQRYLAERFALAAAEANLATSGPGGGSTGAAEPPSEHLLDDLVRATGSEGGERLTRDEAVSALLQLVIAGNESTGSLI